jgi:hypothetical protein
VDSYLRFMERPVLGDAGHVSHDHMERIAHERYQSFDTNRRAAEAASAEVEYEADLKRVEKQATAIQRAARKKPKGGS